MDHEELKFIRACVKGDKARWDEFIQRYAKLIYNYIYNTLRIKGCALGPDTIQDIFQGIFSRLIEDNYRRLRNFKGRNGCKFASWLRTLTINYTLDYLRRQKLTLSLDEESEEGGSLMEIIASDSPGQDEELLQKERLEQLTDCIEKLKTDEKYFIELCLAKGLAADDLMRILKINRGLLDMRKARIIAKLKECFKEKGFVIP